MSVMGFFSVPPRLFPFAIAAVLQAIMPQVSALGHGLGIVVGFLYCYGWLDPVMPSLSTAASGDMHPLLENVRGWECYIRRPEHRTNHFFLMQIDREQAPVWRDLV